MDAIHGELHIQPHANQGVATAWDFKFYEQMFECVVVTSDLTSFVCQVDWYSEWHQRISILWPSSPYSKAVNIRECTSISLVNFSWKTYAKCPGKWCHKIIAT